LSRRPVALLWELALRRLLEQRQGGSKHALAIYIDDNSRKESFWLGIEQQLAHTGMKSILSILK